MGDTFPTPARDLARLRRIASQRDRYDDDAIETIVRLRRYDPPVTYQRMAEALGMRTEAGVINLLKRRGMHPLPDQPAVP